MFPKTNGYFSVVLSNFSCFLLHIRFKTFVKLKEERGKNILSGKIE